MMDKNWHFDRLVKLAFSHTHSMSFYAHRMAEFRPRFAAVTVL